jgi:hypothetical protein
MSAFRTYLKALVTQTAQYRDENILLWHKTENPEIKL